VAAELRVDDQDGQHRFIRYRDEQLLAADASRIAAYLLNRWLEQEWSVTRYRKVAQLAFRYVTPSESREVMLRFGDLVDHIQAHRSLKPDLLGIPHPECEWLDSRLSLAKPDAPIATADFSEFLKLSLPLPFGEGFPLEPCIDREGTMFASFQTPIQENIVALHRRLVADSHLTTSLSNPWRNDLRMLANETISLIDITLHQLYFMAEYRGSEQGWSFEPKALGPRRGQRLKDKLAWVKKITGRDLDANAELPGFHRLRAVRNHFNHFDPPCVAYTVEDVVGWLNDVAQVGRLAWRIRLAAKAQLSTGLIEIIALPRVEFVPRVPALPRVAQATDVGYGSVSWPSIESSSDP
jgi:hypothetical protein